VPQRIQNGCSAGQRLDRRSGDAANAAAARALDHCTVTARRFASSLIASFGEQVRQGLRIEQGLDHTAPGFKQAPGAIGEVVGHAMRIKRFGHCRQHPLLQLGAGRVQAVVDRRRGTSKKSRDILVRAFVNVLERRRLPQRCGQF
jgi:hypothetical protein